MDVLGAVANIIALVTAIKDAVETGEGIGNHIGKVRVLVSHQKTTQSSIMACLVLR